MTESRTAPVVPYVGHSIPNSPYDPGADPSVLKWLILECTICGNAVINADRHMAHFHPDTATPHDEPDDS